MRARERQKILERAIHRLCFARSALMDAQEVRLLLDGLQRWSDAHSDRNGERSERDIERAVEGALIHLTQLMQPPQTHHERLQRAGMAHATDPLALKAPAKEG